MSDQALLVTWFVGFVVTAWIVAGYLWRNGGYYFLVDYLVPFMAGLLWPLVVVVGAIAGLIWLFIQAAKPGRIKLPRPRRERLQRRIDELEAQLGLREDA